MSPEPDNGRTTVISLISSGAPGAAPASACVVVIHGEGLGLRINIDRRAIVVGRSQDADLCIPHSSVSRRHCEFRRDGDSYRVRDLRATNPTRVNDLTVDEAVLSDGDQIAVGESILKFISASSVEARYHAEVHQLATHDALTELSNRRYFIEQVDKEISRSVRLGLPLVMCIVDVDHFKRINDRYGHISGDDVLRQMAAVVRKHARSEDIAARIGGEEFAVVLPELGIDAALAYAETLREAVAAAEFSPGGEPQRITISIGLAMLGPGRDSRSTLMKAADTALYRAKDEGRNRVCVAPPP